MANRGELYSTRMDGESGRRYYFFNIKADRHGAIFMTIAESTKRPNGGFIRNEVFLYEEDVNRFGSELINAMRQFKEIVQSRERDNASRERDNDARERDNDVSASDNDSRERDNDVSASDNADTSSVARPPVARPPTTEQSDAE